jgi:uncharacterized protein (DUF1684 family)
VRTQRGLLVAGALIALVGAGACHRAPADSTAGYIASIQSARAAKDEAFRRQADEPISVAARETLLPLKYFPIDQDYAVTASFVPAKVRTPVTMPTSTGKTRDMEQVGTLAFTLKGRALSLGAFVEAGEPPDHLFVPFTDLTSGTETYAAGRYLDIERNATGIYTIDFNRAYHPFCYYNHDYDCPYPPPSNRLSVPVRAGEKLAQSNIPAAGR